MVKATNFFNGSHLEVGFEIFSLNNWLLTRVANLNSVKLSRLDDWVNKCTDRIGEIIERLFLRFEGRSETEKRLAPIA
jgi:ribosome assembly protein YihI (activator of Der GTPase)